MSTRRPHYRSRNIKNKRTSVPGAYAIKSHNPERPIMTTLLPWGEYEHTIEGTQVSAAEAFRARAHHYFTR